MNTFIPSEDMVEYDFLWDFDVNSAKDKLFYLKSDIISMQKMGFIKIEDDGKITWINHDIELFQYIEFILLCKIGGLYWDGNLVWVNDPANMYHHVVFDENV
jgi:hypothetical protein